MFIRDVHKYYLYTVLSNLLFCAPIVYVFFKNIGLTFEQIFLCETIFSLSVAIFEVPTGAIADRFGKKLSIVLGIVAVIISNLICSIGNDFVMIAYSQVILALGVALTSGADTALLYSSLLEEKREHEFKKYQGTVKLLSALGMSAAALLGGIIASQSMRATFIITALAFVLSIIVILMMKESHKSIHSETPNYWKIITESAQLITRSKWLFWIILFSSTILVSFRLLLPTVQMYMELSKLPIAYFGIASTYFFLTAAVGSKIVSYCEKHLHKWLYLGLSITFAIPLFILSQVQSPVGFLLFGFLYLITAVTLVFSEHEVLKVTPKEKHATVLSFNSLFTRIVFAATSLIFGYLLGFFGLGKMFFLSGMILVVVFCGLLFLKPKSGKITI